MTGTVEFIQRIRYVEIPDEKGEMQVYAIPETVENIRELVRCKNCVNRYDSINCKMYSEGMDTSDDWFCADGEQKEGQ